VLHVRADTRGRVEGGNARSSCAQSLGQRTLRREFEFELTREVLPLKQGVLADITRDHALDLTRLQQDAESKVLDARVVRHHRQLLGAARFERFDQILGNAAQPEATHQPNMSRVSFGAFYFKKKRKKKKHFRVTCQWLEFTHIINYAEKLDNYFSQTPCILIVIFGRKLYDLQSRSVFDISDSFFRRVYNLLGRAQSVA
jgi:hypothetical protein